MESRIASATNGCYKGIEENGVFIWRGIPYAKPPTGELRFRAPERAEQIDGVFDATGFGPCCFQEKPEREMSEDCLTLNIWSPKGGGRKKAVLFFIHGGSFSGGAGSDAEYDGANLCKNGEVVVVTINYRLGVLGFLDFSFLNQAFLPNCGLRDMIMALRWTANNIEAFGGDPNNITVFGQSAGAVAVSALIVIPEAREYIAKAIMMSGDPTLPHRKDQYMEVSKKFLAFAGIRDEQQLLCTGAEELVSYQKEFTKHCKLGSGTFMLEIDGELIHDYPVVEARRGCTKEIPILVGTTREEMSFLFIKKLAQRLDVLGIYNALMDQEPVAVKETLERLYGQYGRLGRVRMASDIVFRIGSTWFAEACSENTDTWMYRFDYASPAMKLARLYSFHSSDIPFVFGNFSAGHAPTMFLLSPFKKKINRLYQEMQQDFFRFAKTGTLPWKKCDGERTEGKCYNIQSHIGHMIDPSIKAEYKKTNYYQRSFAGETNTLL